VICGLEASLTWRTPVEKEVRRQISTTLAVDLPPKKEDSKPDANTAETERECSLATLSIPLSPGEKWPMIERFHSDLRKGVRWD
jgi:hypothetical protein